MFMCKQRIFIKAQCMDFSNHCVIFTSPWFSISMDIIMNLPHSKSYNSILVMVGHVTKMVHFIFYNQTRISEKITKLIFYHVFQYHGLLKNIIFDHGP
jgi:hypothetical protein